MALVIRLDQRPGGVRGGGALDHVGGGLLVGVPLATVAPVLLGNLELLEAGFLPLLEPAQLLFLGDLEPELGDDGAVARELLLELVDLGVGAHPVGFGAETFDPLDEDAPVPAAIVDGELPLARHVAPESPQVRLGALFVGGCRDRDGVIVAGIERRRDAADGPAFAGGIHPLEYADDVSIGEFRIAHRQRQTPLELADPCIERLLFDLLRKVHPAEQVQFVDRAHDRRGLRLLSGSAGRRLQARAQGFKQRVAYGQRAIFGVRTLHHGPGCVRRARAAQGVLADAVKALEVLEKIPVALGDAPAGLRILLQRAQTLLLLLFGKVEPELEDQRAFVGEHALKVLDFLDRARQLVGARTLEHPIDDRCGVPRAEQHPDAPLGRQGAPVSPHRGTLALLVRRIVEGERMDVSRIHPRVEQVHGFALAGPAYTGDQNDYGEGPVLRQLELGGEQVGTQSRHPLFIFVLGNLVAQLRRFEHFFPPPQVQCDIRTGTVIDSNSVRVAPPSIHSRKRECPYAPITMRSAA